MPVLSDGWFELELGDDGRLEMLTLPWMKAPDERSVQVLESYGFIFVDDEVFVPQDAHQHAIDDLLRQSPAVNDLLEGKPPGSTVGLLPPARARSGREMHVIEHRAAGVQIERVVQAHPVHPVPSITHRVTNHTQRTVEVNYYWCVGTRGDHYGVMSEKGDMPPPMLDVLDRQCAVCFVSMLQTLRTDNPVLGWAYVDLNFGRLEPGETKSFQVNLWVLKDLWVGTQFSGLGFVVSDQDPKAAVAANAVVPGHAFDGAFWLLGRLYSPIFVLSGNTLTQETCDILRRAPIRLLASSIRLDARSVAFCARLGIRLVYTFEYDPDPFVAVEQAVHPSLNGTQSPSSAVHMVPPRIVNVLPADIDRQLLLSHYYSQRREAADFSDRYTVPVRNVFIQADSLPNQRYADLLSLSSFVRLLGSVEEIDRELEGWLAQFGRPVHRHEFDVTPKEAQAVQAQLAGRGLHMASERIAGVSLMTRAVSYFANHDYTLSRLGFEGLLDPEHSPAAAFSAAVEKVTGYPGLWDASVELVQEHGKMEIYGPPFAVIVPLSAWGSNAIFNAVLGAQYAKALRACLLPLHFLPQASQSQVRRSFAVLRDKVYDRPKHRENWPEIERHLDTISQELMGCFDTFSKSLLRAGEFSKQVRASYGQRGVYLFHSDHSLPLELVSQYEAFGRSRSIGTLTLFGRMAFRSPLKTALFGAENVLYQQNWYPSGNQVVLAWDPTGDLLGSLMEQASACKAMAQIGITPRLLTGLDKVAVVGDEVRPWSWADSGPYRVVDAREDEHGNVIDERVYEFDAPQDCTIDNFIAAIADAGGIHYTGHGTVQNGSLELLLSDGNLSFRDFPRLDGHPWLLLNACELGRASHQGTSAMDLLDKGAIQVIAPLLAVRDAITAELGLLYGELPVTSLPAAFQFSRHSIFLESSESTDHLAYMIYGDPFSSQGLKLWAAYEAYHCAVTGWQLPSIKEKYHLYERERYLHRLLVKETQLRAGASDGSYWAMRSEFYDERAETSSGTFYATIADALPSSEQRLQYLQKAAKAYLTAAQKGTGAPANQKLMLAYGMQTANTLQVESVTLSFLGGRFTAEQVRREFLDAVAKLDQVEAAFREIGSRDADKCAESRQKLQSIVQLLSRTASKEQLAGVLGELLHTPEGELAQQPPLLSELAQAQQAVSAQPSQLDEPDHRAARSAVAVLRFFDEKSSRYAEPAAFLGEFLDNVQFLAEMQAKYYSRQLAPTDLQRLASATLRLDPRRPGDLVRMAVNNALLKQLATDWLYGDPGFPGRLSEELRANLIGFSGLLASLDATQSDIHVIRDCAQTYFDLFWEGEPRFYVALDEGPRLALKAVDQVTDKMDRVVIGRKGQLRLKAGFCTLYRMRATVEEWADLYTCLLFERHFQIPASQRFRLGQTEFSIRLGVGGIIDIGSSALLVRGESENLFYSQLEERLAEYLAKRLDARSMAPRVDELLARQRERSTEDFIAQGGTLTHLGIEQPSWNAFQSCGIAVSLISLEEQIKRLAARLTNASISVHKIIRQRFG